MIVVINHDFGRITILMQLDLSRKKNLNRENGKNSNSKHMVISDDDIPLGSISNPGTGTKPDAVMMEVEEASVENWGKMEIVSPEDKSKKDKKVKKEKKEKKEKKSRKEKKDKKEKKHKKHKKDKKAKSDRKSTSFSSQSKRPAARASTAGGPPKRRKIIKLTEDDFEPVNLWWEKTAADGESEDAQKWETLEHRGLMFTPDYIPHNVPLIYDGKTVHLEPEAEEVATFFASTLGTDWCEKPKFRDNFWSEFTSFLASGTVIKKLELCDFSKMKEYLDARSADRKARSKDEKDRETELKKESEHPYTHVLVDELRERVGNFRTEPPNLFRGRGEHPKMGQLKKRIMPEDVTLNMGYDAPIPRIDHPSGHAWREVVHDNTVTWLAYYHDTVNGMYKYMFLNAASGFKGQSDWEKYERARKLKKYIHEIRSDYEKKLRSSDGHSKNLGTVAYLIDRLALRVGNEKNTDEEADTVGCCSLRVEHMKFEADYQITLDFLGKDSIRYLNTVSVDAKVYSNLEQFCKRKKLADMIFDIDPDDINKYFKSFMPDLSAKVFRTYNASITLEGELNRLLNESKSPVKQEQAAVPHSMDIDIADLTKLYNEANRRVAILCNHQRAPPKQHEAGMAQLRTKLDELNRYLDALRQLRSDGKRSLSDEQRQVLETNSFNLEAGGQQIQRKIHALLVQVDKIQRTMEEKEENKTVSLTTSKINYMDPRITVAFCKRVDLPIERVFAKTIRNKFPWAMHAHSDWAF